MPEYLNRLDIDNNGPIISIQGADSIFLSALAKISYLYNIIASLICIMLFIIMGGYVLMLCASLPLLLSIYVIKSMELHVLSHTHTQIIELERHNKLLRAEIKARKESNLLIDENKRLADELEMSKRRT